MLRNRVSEMLLPLQELRELASVGSYPHWARSRNS